MSGKMRQYCNSRICGANIPAVPSSMRLSKIRSDLDPATPGGSISGSILGDDQILRGNVTWHHIEVGNS